MSSLRESFRVFLVFFLNSKYKFHHFQSMSLNIDMKMIRSVNSSLKCVPFFFFFLQIVPNLLKNLQ